MQRMGIEALYRRPNTSKKQPRHEIFRYRLRGMSITRANQLWGMDITYIPMARHFVYLRAFIGRSIRMRELEAALMFLPVHCKVLELGAGAGWQAAELSKLGFDVTAIDVEESNYADSRVCRNLYDGHRIPLPDESVDVVFSSNVLEHIPHIEIFQAEIMRVLKPDGVAVHLMPTPVWRFWTSILYYPERIVDKLSKRSRQRESMVDTDGVTDIRMIKKASRTRNFLPPRHGERGNSISELYLFSVLRWKNLFRQAGWHLVEVKPIRLFYSGKHFFGQRLSLQVRHGLSYLLGCSCRLYVVNRKRDSK